MDVEELLRSGNVFDGSIIGYNKGGLIVPIGTLRGFVPASQVSVMRRPDANADTVDARWSKMVGEPIRVTVIEVDRQRHRLILSERSALQETRETIKDRLLDELKEGDIRTGRVTSLADFGAFVNIDGADGLVHLSEISWDRIEHPSEVLKIGQEVKVKIIAVDQDRKRIGLSIRQLQSDPWVVKASSLKEGQLLEGTITHLTKFGAFARLSGEMEGLIHISELSEQRINHPKEVVKEGDVVTLRVIKIDTERRRIGLSLRKVDSAQYADLDWKMMISNEVQDSQKEQAAEARDVQKEQAAEAHDVQKEQAAEAQDVQKEKPVEAHDVQKEQAAEVHDVQKEQAAEAQDVQKEQPVEAPVKKKKQPAEVKQPKPEKPAEVKQPKKEKPAEVKQPKPEKSAEVKQPQAEESAEVQEPQPEESAEVQQPQPEEPAKVQDSPEEPPAAEEAS
ncbi:MAG: hypothetical protein A2W36_00460 [Chloroflexi bacterium RBG_16_58_14]|nr:MAG: hypothetical protein A2W36_00460 [Chloroflexi bacterium RBG_16_58_14]